MFLFGAAFAEEESVVEIPQGSLKGLKVNSVLGNTPYYSFKGIPYAKPPTGLHKFDVSL